MQRTAWLVVLACLSGCSPSAADDGKGKEEGKGKGVVIDLGGPRSRTPADWKEEKPQGNLRWKQFRLPKVEGDPADAELILFRGLGGSAEANVDRWKDQFIPPKGKTTGEVARVEKLKIGGREAVYLDIVGTYLAMDPRKPGKAERKPDYRMLAVFYDGKDNPYQFKLTGPEKTVAHYKKGFDEWLKGFNQK